ncbi:MAG: hypothetical protein QOD91_2665, partial [Frankiales bacterium]|nr:hypothetical protein [Frankiales bacterium]
MSDIEVSDETLEAWFAGVASEYEVPADGFERVLSAAGESASAKRPRFQHPRLVAAAVLIIAAAGGASVWCGMCHRWTATSATRSAAAPGAVHGAPILSQNDAATPASTSGSGSAAAPARAPAPAAAAPFADKSLDGYDATANGLVAAPRGVAGAGVADGA